MKKASFVRKMSVILAFSVLFSIFSAFSVSAGYRQPDIKFPAYVDIHIGYDSLYYDKLAENANVTTYGPIPNWLWLVTPESNGYMSIRLANNPDFALTVVNSSNFDGANVVIQKYVGAMGQQWKFEMDPSYLGYSILSRCSNETKGLTFLADNNVVQSSSYSTTCHVYVNNHTSHSYVKGVCTYCERYLGDVNNDDVVNDMDAILLGRYVANWSGIILDLTAADMNQDGSITSADDTLLKQLVAGWDIWG